MFRQWYLHAFFKILKLFNKIKKYSLYIKEGFVSLSISIFLSEISLRTEMGF